MRNIPPFLALAALALFASCKEQITHPTLQADAALAAARDSAIVLAALARRARLAEGGPALVGGTLSDPMVFTAAIDSVEIRLVARECASPSNKVTVTSPDTIILSQYMCQEGAPGSPGYTCWPPIPGICDPVQVPSDTVSIWSLTSGYASGEEVVFDFETGVSGATGEMRVTGAFPFWTVAFEDGFDSDFNDFFLTVTAFGPPFVSLTADTTSLRPWVRRTTMRDEDGTLWQVDERLPEAADILVRTNLGVDTEVNLTALWLPGSGGHDHVQDTLLFDSIPTVVSALSAFTTGAVGRPVSGFFVKGSDSLASVIDTTDQSGNVSVDFVAGFAGGEILIIAVADTLADTLAVTISEPSLTDLSTWAPNDAYFVGGTSDHPQGTNWYVTTAFRDSVAVLLNGLSDPVGGWYPQANDASLPHGGAFTISVVDFTDPYREHRSHAQGVDIDVSFCMASTNGVDPNQADRKNWNTATSSCPTGSQQLDKDEMYRLAQGVGLRVIEEGDHFHLRPMSKLSLPGSEEE